MSRVYVDDVTFSSQHILSHTQKQVIYKIILKTYTDFHVTK